MKVLFIGGTGVISAACAKHAVEKGLDVYLLNRGKTTEIRHVVGATQLIADIRNEEQVRAILSNHNFDVVVDFIAYEPTHIETDLRLFKNKTNQYIFISTTCVYATPPVKLPITEDMHQENNLWNYAKLKIACETYLQQEAPKINLPFTIVRPSHTYDQTKIPLRGDYTALHRLKNNLPVFIHGDGTSVWPLLHADDFAVGLIALFGRKESIGESFHITSDELLAWNQIYYTMADLLCVKPSLVHVPSDIIAMYDKDLGDGLLGDKTYSKIFDNSKIKSIATEFSSSISFKQGAQQIINWYEADVSRQKVNAKMNVLFELLCK